jgi:hypothetical protein
MLVDGNMIGSAFAPYEGVAKHFELACIWFALRAGKRVNGRTDPNIHKATILDHPLPGCTRQTTGNSGRPEIDVGYGRCRDRLAIGDVCELQMAARLEHAMYFAKHLLLVGAKIDDTVGDNDIGPPILDGQLFEDALAKLNIFQAHSLCRGAGLGKHLFRHIDADNVAMRADLAGGNEAIESGARP